MTNKIAMFLILDTFERHHILIKIEKVLANFGDGR